MKVINIIAFFIMLATNFLANYLPINGKTTGAISEQYPNLFTPAGLTFSIWGVIYLLLLALMLLQFRDSYHNKFKAIGWSFAISCIFNSLWILAWHYDKPGLSVIIMLCLLLTLIFINHKLLAQGPLLIKASFGIYLGWISVATIANISAYLVHLNWSGWGIMPEIWTVFMITTGMVIVMLSMWRNKNPFMALSVIWAFFGIIIRHQGMYVSIVTISIVSIILLTGLATIMFIKRIF
ncbi:MAG: hypothetical protein GX587_00395 [Bacteroidales bacterium]|nr:hypothetical protein [Bacteroidales bacterium]